MTPNDTLYMEQALGQAALGQAQGEVPVGAVIVFEGNIIAQAYNQPIASHNPCAHAEILALQAAGSVLGNYRLKGVSLYVTLEPCPMCTAAMVHARISRCVYGASDPKTGALGGAIDLQVVHPWNHVFEVKAGVLEEACRTQLVDFFRQRR